MRALFVAGAHTDVGKTYVGCALLTAARTRGLRVAAFKPVVSGVDAADWADSDPGRLLAAMGQPLTDETLQGVSPLRFAAPLSPPMAARREGADLRLGTLADLCRQALARAQADLMLVEGAGGVMSPLAEDGLNLDLMAALGLPVLLVGGSYLGSMSHNLTALEVVRARGLAVEALVVSQDADPSAPDFAETLADLRRFSSGTPVVGAARNAQAWAADLL
ncbi:dethiobiotin synthase [Phenylobacterium sp.]|uniref:dethiobiotin synthase n=1 Tax=Phenylobacterium sp. TaxID=1871053 RepID=UPI0019CEE222|nr:dethiobiotin synthase [Phenylobacterium sp.]MBC7167336.1 dethiobiotin synthase [Phenylobacterium sp.]